MGLGWSRESGDARFLGLPCFHGLNVRFSVSVQPSHLESIEMIRHRPHEGDRGDDGSSIDSRAPSTASTARSSRLLYCSNAASQAHRLPESPWVTASTRTWCIVGCARNDSA